MTRRYVQIGAGGLNLREPERFEGQTLDELKKYIVSEHAQLFETALQRAYRIGEALHAAKRLVPSGQWQSWVDKSLPFTDQSARNYMFLAENVARIPESYSASKQALAYLQEAGITRGMTETFGAGYPEHVKRRARKLHQEGMTGEEIAKTLNVSKSTVSRWVRGKQYNANRRRREKAARAALKRAERDRAMKRLGGDVGEVYSLVRRLAQAVDQARTTSEDKDFRLHLSIAATKLHQVEDEIVRAVGLK